MMTRYTVVGVLLLLQLLNLLFGRIESDRTQHRPNLIHFDHSVLILVEQ